MFHRGFKAYNSYANGEVAISLVACPVLFLLGTQDQMKQAKAATVLTEKAKSAGKTFKVFSLAIGRHQMTDAPEETLIEISGFLK